MKTITYSLFVLLILLTSVVKAQNAKITSVPDIDVYDINGNHTTLAQLAKGKVLFIDSWFIPCPPCFIEMGMLHKLYEKYKDNKDFCFITLSRTDSSVVKKFIKQGASVAKYVASYKYFSRQPDFKLPVYFIQGCDAKVVLEGKQMEALAPTDKTKCPDAQFGFDGYPTVIIFDKQGKLITMKTGYDGRDEANMAHLESIIDPALAAK